MEIYIYRNGHVHTNEKPAIGAAAAGECLHRSLRSLRKIKKITTLFKLYSTLYQTTA